MPRTLFLLGVPLASALSATTNCTAAATPLALTQSCSSCVTTVGASTCSDSYTAVVPVTCVPCATPCQAGPCTSNCASACSVCTSLAGAAGICVGATQGTGYRLSNPTTVDASISASLDLQLFGIVNAMGTAVVAVEADSSVNSTVVLTGNAIATLKGTAPIVNLMVGSGDSSSVMLEVNSAVTVTSWNNNAKATKVDNNNAALVVTNLAVGGSTLAVYQTETASCNLANIKFDARTGLTGKSTILLAGGAASVGMDGAATGTITGTGTIELAGGVSISGNTPSTVAVNVVASGRTGPIAVVDKKTFNVDGNVGGTSGTIVVTGQQFILGSTTATVDPKVVVRTGGEFFINSATAFRAKTVSIATGATLTIGASTKQGQVMIENLAECAGAIQIRVASFATATAIAFNYSASTVVANLKPTAVKLINSAGVEVFLTAKASGSASTGRRLLATSGTYSWDERGMSYSTTGSNSASVSFAIAPILLTALAGLLL